MESQIDSEIETETTQQEGGEEKNDPWLAMESTGRSDAFDFWFGSPPSEGIGCA